MKKSLLFLLLLVTSLYGYTQEPVANIKGQVADSTNLNKIDYATLLLLDVSTGKTIKTALTNSEGVFVFNGVVAGTYKITAGAMGYRNSGMIIKKIMAGENDLGTILLSSTSTALKEVAVVARKLLIEQSDDKITFNAENDPSSATSTAIDILRKTPFVTVDGDNNIQVNGQSNFKVLLNGKETALFAQNLKEALKGFPGSLVRKVEVITNPSAKYDAEGIGGIINIITDKKISGSNGSLSTYYSTLTNYQGSANFNTRTGKFGISAFGNAAGSFDDIKSRTLSETIALKPGFYTSRQIAGIRQGKNLGRSGSLEISYDADSLNTFSIYGNAGNSTGKAGFLQTLRTDLSVGAADISHLDLTSSSENRSATFGLDYFRKGKANKEEEFSMRFNGQLSDNDNFSNSLQTRASALDFLKNNSWADNEEYTLQADYLKSLKGSQKLEFGVKGIFRKAIADYESFVRNDPSAPFVLNPANTNTFEYKQEVVSAYGSYNFKLGKYAFRTGIRGEKTTVEGAFSSSSTLVKQDYFNVIPNLQVTRRWNDVFSSVLGYTVRLQRPSITNLNPFINNTDPLNISYGNPDLGAQTFHNVTLQTRMIKGNSFAGVTLYLSSSNNLIAQYAIFDALTGVTQTTSGNIGREEQVSVIFNFSTRIGNNLSVWANSIVRYNTVDSRGAQAIVQDGYSGNFYTGGNLKLSDWFNISGSGGFNRQSNSVLGPGGYYSSYQVNFGYVLLKDKLSGTVNFNNTFKKDFYAKSYVENANFQTVNTNINPYRVIYFGMTYRFGKLKENVSRKKGVNNDDLLGQ
ncbi:MAG: TonB-dependent receptor [Pedobacter sp.]|nr:MAG: TonB-dependent receptor [Pedobacter sp.]